MKVGLSVEHLRLHIVGCYVLFSIAFASCIGILWSGDSNSSALSPSPRTLVYTTREQATSPWSSRSVLYHTDRIRIRNNLPGSENRSGLFSIIFTMIKFMYFYNYKQCCGTGTVGTVTFCLLEPEP